MLITVIVNVVVLLSINSLSIVDDTNMIRILCIILGFSAATYDIAYDALRIEKLDTDDQALGAAIASLGYKTGSYITGAGVLIFVSTSQLYQVSFDPWKMAIYIISGIFALGFIFTLTISSSTISSSSKNFAEAVIEPVKDILKRENIIWIVLLIVTFKGGQAMLNFMCFPFYAKLGYTDGQIALVVKSFGIIMSMLGIFIGGLFIKKFGLYKGILYCGLLQALSDFSFIWLNYQNGELWALFVNIMLENISGGMGSCGLVSLISVLCNKQFAGAHFAIFSSLAVLINSTMSGFAGKIVDNVGWNWFFFTDFMISLPPLFIVFYLYKKYEAQPTKI
jgi:PAT family beta-lactamase induction signal transducer AmpG